MHRLFVSRALATLGALALAGSAAAAPLFHVTDLGPFNTFNSKLGGINAAGVVVGAVEPIGAFSYQAVVFDHGAIIELGTFGGPSSVATAINDAGVVVGSAQDVHFSDIGFTWTGNGLQALPTLGGGSTVANAINQAGEMAGTSTNSKGHFRAFKLANGVMVDLGLPPHGLAAQGTGINEAGVVVGRVALGDHTVHGFVHRNGRMEVLPAGEGALVNSEAVAINNRGQIAGTLYSGVGTAEAVVFDADGVHPLLPGNEGAASSAINDRGHVVGSGPATAGWFHDGKKTYMLDRHLDEASAGWHIVEATGINADDAIAAVGRFGDGDLLRALLLVRVR